MRLGSAFFSALALLLAVSGVRAEDGAPAVPALSIERLITGAVPAIAGETATSPEGTDTRLAAADIEEMIGQLLMVGFPGSDPRAEWTERVAGMIQAGRIGGVVLFGDNVESPAQLRELIGALGQPAGGPRLFVAVDQEGGTIQRLTRAKGFVGLPSAQTIAHLGQLDAYRAFRKTASELAGLGINVNLGPVVDLNINPDNPAIGGLKRTFGSDPDTVIAFARQFVDAHKQAGILTAAKHFPGHGSAAGDPHDVVVDITDSWQEAEIAPFVDLIGDNFVDMIMVGHLIHPRFSDGDRPASLSARAISGMLRGQLNYDGLVVTDDLDMGAIRERYGVEEAAVMAVAAGADLLIVANHEDPDPAIAERLVAAIAAAVADGRIPRARIEESYRRIVAVKRELADRRAFVMQ